MLRPWWLGMLGFALLVASVFAWLGQWQLARAVDTSPPEPGQTEIVRPIADVSEPGAYLPDPLVGQRVEVTGSFVADDFIVVSSRFDEGVEGYWVTGQLRVDPADTGSDAPTSLAVAVGWTGDRETADAAARALDADPPQDVALTGRLISGEGPAVPPRSEPWEITRMDPAALLSRWSDIEDLDVYRGYLTSAEPFAGLDDIHSPAPEERSSVNWLNIFYAVEWAVFAGFAFYMWYRLAKDAWEKELEAIEDAAIAAGAEADAGGTAEAAPARD
ncbi:SURF1 family protein [Microbacterium radiodurans]|uniref:SURF1-like protein n=2 Tax=Microbacterium radiodurans TaxID=661398 RepID=A0A5J5IN69_9MICO|nr:SURF1 family protein [Microbacterium radiodurans]